MSWSESNLCCLIRCRAAQPLQRPAVVVTGTNSVVIVRITSQVYHICLMLCSCILSYCGGYCAHGFCNTLSVVFSIRILQYFRRTRASSGKKYTASCRSSCARGRNIAWNEEYCRILSQKNISYQVKTHTSLNDLFMRNQLNIIFMSEWRNTPSLHNKSTNS